MTWGAGDHFRLWLRAGMTGCEFAKLLAGKGGGVAMELHVDVSPPQTARLNEAFDEHGQADRVAVAVFPSVTSEAAIVELLNALHDDARWTLRRHPKPSPSGGALVGLEWTTRSGDISDVMGFAPFPTMPVPRRSPYVAIATWPGGRSNPFRGTGSTPPGRAGIVSFLDAAHDLDPESYEDRWKATSERVTDLMSAPPDDARLYRRTTFVLTGEQAAGLAVDR
jgi:hypothetical protein